MDDVQGKGKGKITTMPKTETKTKSKAARQEPADITIPNNDDSSSGPDTDSSVYKSELLEKESGFRYIKASHVREQVERMPSKGLKTPNQKRPSQYPKVFGKRDDGIRLAPLLQSKAPRKEYPLVPGTGEPYPGHGPPGPLRSVSNLEDRKKFDVDEKQPRKNERKKKESKKKEEKEKEKETETETEKEKEKRKETEKEILIACSYNIETAITELRRKCPIVST